MMAVKNGILRPPRQVNPAPSPLSGFFFNTRLGVFSNQHLGLKRQYMGKSVAGFFFCNLPHVGQFENTLPILDTLQKIKFFAG